jgi:hypothetical protein
MRLDIYDTTMHETRSELKPWYPRVLHAACASEPADRLRTNWMYSPKGSRDCSEVTPGYPSVRGAMEVPVSIEAPPTCRYTAPRVTRGKAKGRMEVRA